MKIRPNCYRCCYGGSFIQNKHLASCSCEYVTESTVMEFDTLFNKERKYVFRDNWEDECECENFIPMLSESNGDYELEAVCTFNTSFECPFCGSTVYVMDLGIEETAFVTCDECEKQMAVKGKEI